MDLGAQKIKQSPRRRLSHCWKRTGRRFCVICRSPARPRPPYVTCFALNSTLWQMPRLQCDSVEEHSNSPFTSTILNSWRRAIAAPSNYKSTDNESPPTSRDNGCVGGEFRKSPGQKFHVPDEDPFRPYVKNFIRWPTRQGETNRTLKILHINL